MGAGGYYYKYKIQVKNLHWLETPSEKGHAKSPTFNSMEMQNQRELRIYILFIKINEFVALDLYFHQVPEIQSLEEVKKCRDFYVWLVCP